MAKVAAYIDGFNLYNGMKDAKWKKYYWLNLRGFCEALLSPGDSLVTVRYFTSKVESQGGSRDRQSVYLAALRTEAQIHPVYGKFTSETQQCRSCSRTWVTWTEKMTDVAIAVALLTDAYSGLYETAYLVCADRDLVPAARAITSSPLNKQLHVYLPPSRQCPNLKNAAHVYRKVDEAVYRANQMPNPVVTQSGRTLYRPASWR